MLDLILNNYQDILFNTARIFSSVFELVLAYILVNTFFSPRLSRRGLDVLPFAVLAAGVIFLVENGVQPWMRYLIECAALTALLFAAYVGPARKKALGSMVFALLIAVSQIGSRLLLSLITRRLVSPPDPASPYMQLVSLTTANCILILLAVLLTVPAKRTEKNVASLRLWTVLLAVPAVTLVTFSVFQYYIDRYPENDRIFVYIYLSCLGLIFINVLVFLLFSRLRRQLDLKRETDMLAAQLELQEGSISRLETLYNRTRTFRHDIKNHILLLNVLAEQQKYEELRDYLRELSGAIDESDYVRISGISAVDAILNEKMYEAQAEHITTHFDVVNLDKNDIAPIDLCIILSNALDNAIEANRLVEPESERFIRVKVHGNETFSVISVSNPTARAPRTNAEGEFVTSKPDGESHGFGLKSIENTAKKYNGEQIAKCEDNVFTLVVRLNSRGKEANANGGNQRF